MLPEMAKMLVRRLYEEMWNDGRLGVADAIFADNYIDHDPPSPTGVWPTGAEGAKRAVDAVKHSFPDARQVIRDMVAESDLVAVRADFVGTHRGEFMGVPPTGRPISVTSVALFRLAEGEITESWGQIDVLEVLQMIGGTPKLEPGPSSPAPVAPAS